MHHLKPSPSLESQGSAVNPNGVPMARLEPATHGDRGSFGRVCGVGVLALVWERLKYGITTNHHSRGA